MGTVEFWTNIVLIVTLVGIYGIMIYDIVKETLNIPKERKMIDKDGKEIAGYISRIQLPDGKLYKLQCEVVEVYPMTCPKCGGRVELHYGNGNCQSCGTAFTTQFKIVEE